MINESKRKELDSHWEEIGKLAEKYGFILFCSRRSNGAFNTRKPNKRTWRGKVSAPTDGNVRKRYDELIRKSKAFCKDYNANDNGELLKEE